MDKLKAYYENLDIESKARLQGAGGMLVIVIVIKIIGMVL